jgi:hypothetical protein
MPWATFKTLKFGFLAVILGLSGLFTADPALAEKRVALVIGNSAYRNVAPLDNPRNDARLMATTLQGLGFQLVGNGPQIDLDKQAFDAALSTFGNAVLGADVALFYYAGHGVQVAGRNFLVPVSANPTKEADVYLQMVDTNVVMSQMEGAGTKLNIVLLDACRNNPFGGRGLRAIDRGLAQMQAPEGTLISYATQPGNVAQDGASANSPYSKALASTIKKPGLGLFDAFNEVGLTVKEATGGTQQPWVSSSPIAGTFYFASPAAGAGPADKPAASAADESRKDFDLAQQLDTRDVWEAFVQKYPAGFLTSAARARLDELKKKEVALVQPAPVPPAAALPPLAASPSATPAPFGKTISGFWRGTYSYASGNQAAVNFTVSFGSNGCSGRSEEPNTFGNSSAPKLFANFSCPDPTLAPGHVITFSKTYDGTGGVSHSVIYTGTVSADMRTISGRWAINSTRGNFTMSR